MDREYAGDHAHAFDRGVAHARSTMLTPRELQLLDEINAVHAGFIAIAKEAQAADGLPAYSGDSMELGWHIHMLQNWVLSQAAARAYPGKFRMVGCGHKDQAALDAGAADA